MRYIRRFWLRDPETNHRWNLTPDNPHSVLGGSALVNPVGLGFEQTVEQTQIDLEYFVNQIKSKNTNLTGTVLFFGDKHIDNFRSFIGDFRKQFEFHYSPDGSIISEDMVTPSWYKPVVLTLFQKTERNASGVYEIGIRFTTQADAWKRANRLKYSGVVPIGEAHVYNFFYNFFYGGKSVLATDIENFGSETSTIVRISNIGSVGNIINPEWTVEHIYTNALGNETIDRQRARFNVTVRPESMLEVDSNPLTQHAFVFTGSNVENVKNLEEPDYAFIGYVTLRHGHNRVIFNINVPENADIKISYDEVSEVV